MEDPSESTDFGAIYCADSIEFLRDNIDHFREKFNLIITSPPFPLNRKKKYGNYSGEAYRGWFRSLAPLFSELLAPDGSIVIEMGNSWVPGRPVQSTLHLEALLAFVNHVDADLRLCQEFICYNPARLPSPAEWVTKRRIRVTDSYTHVWWIAKTDYPKADNKNVLRPYSRSMHKLLSRGTYNSGSRPSEHNIGATSFLSNHGGSITPNFLELEPLDPDRDLRTPNAFSHANTASTSRYLSECRRLGLRPHPARMPIRLANFFIEFLTDPHDHVLDPFAGSGTTLVAAESHSRKWTGVELDPSYVAQAKLRIDTLDPDDKPELESNHD